MRLRVNRVAPLAALVLLSACGGAGDKPKTAPAQPIATGPAADYPVVVGEPFIVGSTTYTPIDRMNFDAVGYAAIGSDGGTGISAAHKTLPLPSYVEITSLASGKTILARVERRGPMTNDRLVELSPGAAAQLGVGEKTPVRVRRVNPPEPERALLRTGQRAPERMETPKPLLDVLMRRIDPRSPVLLSGGSTPPARPGAASRPAPTAAGKPIPKPKPVAMPMPAPTPAALPAPSATPAPKPSPAPASRPAPAVAGTFVVQVGAYSNRANAGAVAAKVGGRAEPAGKLFRVRSGPFATKAEADAALAKARSAGYSDARIQRVD